MVMKRGSTGGGSFVKRIVDFVAALVALILSCPILILTALLVRVRLGHPVLFRQVRVGRNEVPFQIVKFRTMTDRRDQNGELLPDVGRLSSFGRFLRSTSLDELPELWNVVKGEMSLVGPRPLPVDYLPRYSAIERRRHLVRPGITGWAQVNGRNALDWNDRLAADVWYVDNQSLKLDVKVIGRTLLSVVRREGVSAPGESTMYELPHHEDRVVS
jgi:lipopolysaccharide/colanic/teichoic acid biosynthesis glycosyltransferase